MFSLLNVYHLFHSVLLSVIECIGIDVLISSCHVARNFFKLIDYLISEKSNLVSVLF